MDYLENLLKTDVAKNKWGREIKLPYFLSDTYGFEEVEILGCRCLFISPKGKVPPISSVRTHLALIRKVDDAYGVLHLRNSSSYQRRTMIDFGIPFVVEDRQVYLPFLAICLQKETDRQPMNERSFSPSSQLLFLLSLYEGQDCLPMVGLSKRVSLSTMSISRAFAQLEDLSLAKLEQDGVRKSIRFSYGGRELYEKAKPFLASPISKKGYLKKESVPENAIYSGESALSGYSMLSAPKYPCYAVYNRSKESLVLERDLVDATSQVMLETWKYDPLVISRDGKVDPISLSLAFDPEDDPRLETALENLIDSLW